MGRSPHAPGSKGPHSRYQDGRHGPAVGVDRRRAGHHVQLLAAATGGKAEPIMTTTAGETFARAVAAKDQAALRAVLSDTVDFQALTPGRVFRAETGTELAVEVILGTWFARAQMDELCAVTTGRVAGREHVAYR